MMAFLLCMSNMYVTSWILCYITRSTWRKYIYYYWQTSTKDSIAIKYLYCSDSGYGNSISLWCIIAWNIISTSLCISMIIAMAGMRWLGSTTLVDLSLLCPPWQPSIFPLVLSLHFVTCWKSGYTTSLSNKIICWAIYWCYRSDSFPTRSK